MAGEDDVLRRAAAWSEAGLGVALATVVSTWGSAPRRAGSQLAVNERGEMEGSVSGGCVEADVVREALELLGGGKARLLTYQVSNDRAWEVGLACGGRVQVHLARLDRVLVGELLAALAAGRPAVVATDLGTGVGRLVDPAAEAEPDRALLAAAREAVARDRSERLELPGADVFLRAYGPPVRVVIVGAVHIAQALAPMARLAGYEVLLVDPRPAFASEARFPGIPLARGWPDEALRQARLDVRSAVVALTHDPKLDDPALATALRSPAFYLGALGSKKTQQGLRERLRAQGFGEADLARIHGPVGLDLGAVSPGEIAVSILSELVQCLRSPRP